MTTSLRGYGLATAGAQLVTQGCKTHGAEHVVGVGVSGFDVGAFFGSGIVKMSGLPLASVTGKGR